MGRRRRRPDHGGCSRDPSQPEADDDPVAVASDIANAIEAFVVDLYMSTQDEPATVNDPKD